MFRPDDLVLETKACMRGRKTQRWTWDKIEKISVNYFCFSGVLAVKFTDGEQHHFKMKKSQMMHAASAIHRKIGTSKGKVDRLAVVDKARKVLQNDPNVGIGSDGLMLRRRVGCCSAGVVLASWDSITSARLSRGCTRGTITVNTIMKKEGVVKPVQAKTMDGFRGGGENLLNEVDEDVMAFTDDRKGDVLVFTISASVSEVLYSILETRMAASFADLEEVADACSIHSPSVIAHAAKAGLIANTFKSCSREEKVFIPWSSMIAVTYKKATCCRKSCLTVKECSGKPMLLYDVKEEAYESLANVFSSKSLEDVVSKRSQPVESGFVDLRGLEPRADGLYDDRASCCRRNTRVFIPWSKIDCMILCSAGVGFAKVILVTEVGERLRIAKKRTTSAWELFNKLRTMKYGVTSADVVRVFNQVKDERYSSKLTDCSITLSLDKGNIVKEIDLDRVMGARRGRATHTQLEIGISMGAASEVISVPLLKDNNARDLARDINKRAADRKARLKQEAAGTSA